MIPDLDATHAWNGEVILNDNWEADGTPKFPRFRVRDMPGFHSLPEAPDNRDTPVGRLYREVPRLSLPAGKALTYAGLIEGSDEDELDAGEEILTNAFQDRAEGEMVITQYVTGRTFLYKARVTALDIPGSPGSSLHSRNRGFSRQFALGLRMLDGRFYDGDTEETIVSTSTAVVGGLTLPTAVPFTAGDVTAGLPGVLSVAPNLKVPLDPVITIPGPAGDIAILNTSMNRRLAMREDFQLNTGQSMVIDFAARSIIVDGIDFAEALDDDASDYWERGVPGLQKGPNVLQLVSSSVTSMSLRMRRAFLG